MVGHYMSAASRMAAATGDERFRDRVNYIVAELARCQAAIGLEGYLAAFPTSAFDRLEGQDVNAQGIVVPYYTVHKIMAGLLDAHTYLGNAQALEVAEKMAAYFENRLAGLSEDVREQIFRTDYIRNPQNEFGAMNDVLVELFRITGDERHLSTAKLFNRDWFIDPLVQGEDRLEGLHANTHIAATIGIAATANADDDSAARTASENFWDFVVQRHSFANGGNSFKEWFDEPDVEVGASIDDGKRLPSTTCESCNTHNMLRLTTRLIERSPDPEYGDYWERALFNHILATMAPDTGAVTYYTPLHGNFRTYLEGTHCCVGTGIENAPRYGEGIYFRRGDALFVNLYIPSEVTWREAGLVLRQDGDVRAGEPIRLIIVEAGDGEAELNFRVPFWIAGPATLSIDGTVRETAASPSSYITVRRRWSAGDELVLTLPAAPRLERAMDDPAWVALFYGPTLLAGEFGDEGMPDDFADKDAYLDAPPVDVPDVVTSSTDPEEWLEPIPNERLAFRLRNVGPADGVVLRPIHEIHHQRFSVYWRVRSA
jgi:DUF1680 family protein